MTPYTPNSIREVLSRLPLFCELNADEINLLLPGVREYRARTHEILFNKGDRLDGIHVVVTGKSSCSCPPSKARKR